MKRLLFLIIIVFIPLLSFADTLFDLQNYVYCHTPALMSEGYFTLTGEIMEIQNTENNHYEMIIKVDEEKVMQPMGSEYPYFIAHFRLHLNQVPFDIGDVITVTGGVNPIYSSPAVPYLLVSTINGSDDY